MTFLVEAEKKKYVFAMEEQRLVIQTVLLMVLTSFIDFHSISANT